MVKKIDVNQSYCDETDILKRDESDGCAAQQQRSLDCKPRRGSFILCCSALVRRRCSGREVAATTALLGFVILVRCRNQLSVEILATGYRTQDHKKFYFEPIKGTGSCCKKIELTNNVISILLHQKRTNTEISEISYDMYRI